MRNPAKQSELHNQVFEEPNIDVYILLLLYCISNVLYYCVFNIYKL